MSVVSGILFHAAGASSASMCYTPQKKLQQWSWQTYWLAQAAVCWLILPVLAAWITIPHLGEVLREAPSGAMLSSFLLGAAYGIGGTAFGMAIRYIGFSLTYAFAVGISCVLGTLLPPVLHGTLMQVLEQQGAGYIMSGLLLGIMGIVLCGASGRMKEKDIQARTNHFEQFNMAKGLPVCILAGILSAFYGLSLDQGAPIAEVAVKYGAGDLSGNVIYIFSNTGAFVTTALYCLFLHRKEGTGKEFFKLPEVATSGVQAEAGAGIRKGILLHNYLLSILTGVLWYGQFFFYGLGHVRLGAYQFSSWSIHMIMLVMISAILGIIMKEWSAAKSITIKILVTALVILFGAILLLTYGNYLGA